MENNMEGSEKIKNRTIFWFWNLITVCVSKGKEIGSPCSICIHMSISASLTHPDVEITQVSMNRWMDKEAVTHTHRGILFSHEKKKRKSDICNNMDKPWRDFAKWNKSDIRQILYDITYVHSKKAELLETECRMVVSRD